jgi:hypothetical protein
MAPQHCAGAAVKLAYWRNIDHAPRTHSAGDATGLGPFGAVRPLDPPHSRPNFVMREMGYRVARKHARSLRLICVVLGFAVPVVATALVLWPVALPASIWATLALVSAAAGIFIERWLFFAEEQHVVTLYYGAKAA